MLEIVRRAAAEDPSAVALDAHDATLSYGALLARAASHAARLAEVGVGPERIVALRLPRSAALVEAVVATLWCGGAFAVPTGVNPRRCPHCRKRPC